MNQQPMASGAVSLAVAVLCLVMAVASSEAKAITVPLTYGLQSKGQWSITAHVGAKPGVNVAVTFDTGSSLLYIMTASGYPNKTVPTGYPGKSKSAVNLQIPQLISYGSGNVTGTLYNDSVVLATPSGVRFPTLNLTSYTLMSGKSGNASSSEANGKIGVMGWTFNPKAGSAYVPVVDALWKKGAIPQYLFSTYLTMATSGSVVTIGGVDTSSYVAGSGVNATVIPNTGQRSDLAPGAFYFWMINLAQVSLLYSDGSSLLLGTNYTAIVDSGTATIKTPPAALASIYAGLSTKKGPCLTGINFTLSGGSLVMPVANQSCSFKMNPTKFDDRFPQPIVNTSQWWTLGAPFTASFYTIWNIGAKSMTFATPIPTPISGSASGRASG